MTTATEHHDAQLAAIKARHEVVRAKLADPAVTEIDDITDFAMVQYVGMMTVYVDPIGRFWTVSAGGEPRKITAKMVFDPGPRAIGYSHGDRSAQPPATTEVLMSGGPDGDAVWDDYQRKWVPASDPDDTQAAQGFKAHEG